MTQNQAEKRYGNGTLPTDQPNPEVLLQAKRRTFTVNYKQWLLEEVDKCREQSGQIGALLRREGLCQYAAYNVPGICTNTTPPIRTNTAPPMRTHDAPPRLGLRLAID